MNRLSATALALLGICACARQNFGPAMPQLQGPTKGGDLHYALDSQRKMPRFTFTDLGANTRAYQINNVGSIVGNNGVSSNGSWTAVAPLG